MGLTEDDIHDAVQVLEGAPAQGRTSMQRDLAAGRPSELDPSRRGGACGPGPGRAGAVPRRRAPLPPGSRGGVARATGGVAGTRSKISADVVPTHAGLRAGRRARRVSRAVGDAHPGSAGAVRRRRARRQADDLTFRYTDHPGRRDARWEDRLASIVVTGATVLVHKNEKVGVEITPDTRRRAAVERSGSRVRIRVGQGRTEELWSFVPPDDPSGWADDFRAVIHRSDSEANRP